MVRKDSANYSKGKLAVGYGVIALLIGAIVYLYIMEKPQLFDPRGQVLLTPCGKI